MLAKENVFGTMVELVVGVADSEPGAESWRGRFGSGVAVVGSVCRLRPRDVVSVTAKRDPECTNLLGESQKA